MRSGTQLHARQRAASRGRPPRGEHGRVTFADRRRAYLRGQLGDDAAGSDPIATLAVWIDEAFDAGEVEATAMALATVDASGGPHVRYVLCKGVTARGVRFFTNLASDKALQLAGDPRAAATFWWPQAERSVRLTGTAEPLPRGEVNGYFATRPPGSQLGAYASHQSRPIDGRAALDAQARAAAARFATDPPAGAPDEWGGYHLTATTVELWHGRADRLHDRLRYTRAGDAWTAERLQP